MFHFETKVFDFRTVINYLVSRNLVLFSTKLMFNELFRGWIFGYLESKKSVFDPKIQLFRRAKQKTN